jgi:predicted nucleic acid-binding protein
LGLIDGLEDGPIGLDTSAVIYFIERHPRYISELRPLFVEADRGRRVLVTSALTLLEVLVVPIRRGQLQLADRYEQLLTRSRAITLVDISVDQLRAAAGLRASLALKTPDALQVVAAISASCKTFITNDRRLPHLPGLKTIQLSDYA